MAYPTLRENRRSATHQLATHRNRARMMVLVQDPFYRHDSLGPGAPLVEITGTGEGAGFYDWAGRRLFLAGGEPDPMCPGAYRYQHNPDCCDLEAPDSDPRSPRYEPMHLRHQAGDTWIIDTNRPHDPYDPGPYGTPGWYRDERTGRHRRDETPDPLPAHDWTPPQDAWFPGTADWPEPGASPKERPERSASRGGADRPPGGRPGPSGEGEPPRPWGRRSAPPAPDADRRTAKRPGGREERGFDARGELRADGYRFSKLREDAFDRFMVQSAQLRAAHFQPERPYLRERAAWLLRRLLWVLACGLAPMPAPLASRTAAEVAPRRATAQAAAQGGPAAAVLIPSQPGGPRAEEPRPGAALAAAVDGARAARAVIAARDTRGSAARHWRARPGQDAPSRPAPGAYMTVWEQAFDTGTTVILAAGSAS